MNPKAFISYAWESEELKKWVKDFATTLRSDGIDVKLDQWELVPVVDEITTPTMDGSRGSALYSIPFELSKTPPYEWKEFFIQSWNLPPSFSTMHRPGIASVYGNKIVLNGTTIEEVEKVHKGTLKLCVSEANKNYNSYMTRKRQRELEEQKRIQDHKKTIDDISKRIDFE